MLLILLAFLAQAWAIPTSAGPRTIPTSAHIILWGIEPRDDGSGTAQRTMYQVVRSCFLTIAACVYRSIHQNIPDPKAGWWKRQIIRVKITFWALIAPELMVWWALRQWTGAKVVMDDVNKVKPELKWTHTHGHFAQMGGFGRLDNERILYPSTLISLLEKDQIDVNELKRISEKRINDCSKGDILSKGIIALQTLWFAFECFARLHQNLPLLDLEVVTLAFAALNTLTYAFWWHKPLDVLCPIYLHIRPEPTTTPEISSASISGSSLIVSQPVINPNESESEPFLGENSIGINRQKSAEAGWVETATGTLRAGWSAMGKAIDAGLQCVKKDIQSKGWWNALILDPILALTAPLRELFRDETVHIEATHVSTFYAKKVSDEGYRLVGVLIGIIGIVFGAIHFLSWHSCFPTHTQLILWKISSIVLVAEPLCMALLGFFVNLDERAASGSWQKSLWQGIWFFFGSWSIFFSLAYIPGRVCILVLAFLTLHRVPLAAVQSVSWTAYIPHV
ncbi:hypothetical protein BDN72DRAFT_905337 [Pluteus cervinus]|uniref:Uncharacterized protein n=1 Tax=Pluteus cervinus TaxID=181527 RepID=A0ACD3A2X5_9AGAR|nr:hypothetical protein BDN72DRAFT_905337 [Pluteus cervinus]